MGQPIGVKINSDIAEDHLPTRYREVVLTLSRYSSRLLPAAEIKPQRRVWQMRVIVLRSWPDYRAFIVVVILIANIPIEPMMQIDREPRFRRLITHRIRRDQRSGIAGRIGDSISLAIVLIDSIGREQRRPWSDSRDSLYKEEIVPHNVKVVAEWMANAIEEIVDDRFAIYPMVIV